MRAILVAILIVATLPSTHAATQTYVGPYGAAAAGQYVGVGAVCEDGLRVGVGGGCRFACEDGCRISVVELASPDVHVMVCEASAIGRCFLGATSMTFHTRASAIRVHVFNGVAGTITVEPI